MDNHLYFAEKTFKFALYPQVECLVVVNDGRTARLKTLNLGFRPQAVDIFGDNLE